jgi:iron complex transport system ATP-binding protein
MDKKPTQECLQTTGLSVGYTLENPLLKTLDLVLRAGELVCFMGQNGVGKSTLIRTLAGLQRPLAGDVQYHSQDKSSHLLPQNLAVVLTDRVTATNMTVYDVVSFGRYPYMNWAIRLTERDHLMIDETLRGIRIHHLKDKRLHELSDGQVQMVMIARAVVQDTPIILLDEPTAHLDLNNRLEIMNLLRKLAHDSQKAILVSTHELDLALQTADLIWLASHEKKIITGIPEDLVLNGAFDNIFQFKGFDLRTGKIQHEPHRKLNVKLVGSGHEYLWTKNAFERNGFTITEQKASHTVVVDSIDGQLRWILNNETNFSSLQALLFHLI